MRSHEKEVCNVPSFKTITADNRKKNWPFACPVAWYGINYAGTQVTGLSK